MATRTPTETSSHWPAWLPRLGGRPRAAPAKEPVDWQTSTFGAVGDFLFGNRLDPTPDNYDLAFQYRAAVNARLVEAVRCELDTSGILTADAAERIFAESAGPITASSLAGMADRIEAQVTTLTTVSKASREDADAFCVALEESCAGDAVAPDTILALTRSMISRTRVAEAQLRRSAKELTGLRATLREAQRFADVDSLTDLLNRRAFKRDLENAMRAARKDREPLALAFCDIDNFKRLNDAHGHETGDRVLRFVAALMAQRFAKVGLVGRFGGEEFVIMFPKMNPSDAFAAVDACRAELSQRRLYSATDRHLIGSITFSAGVAALLDGDGVADILRRADEALYRAKGEGRNLVLMG